MCRHFTPKSVIFQFQEQGKYHQMILAGLNNSRYSRQNLAIYEIETAQALQSFALVNKQAFTSLYGLGQNKLIGQDNDISLLIYQDHFDQEVAAQEYLQKTGLIIVQGIDIFMLIGYC